MNYPKTDPCPTCHVATGEACVHYGTTGTRDTPHRERMPEWWDTSWSEGYAAATADVKAAVEEWFCNVSLDDLFNVKGWTATTSVDSPSPATPNCGCPDGAYDLHEFDSCTWLDES